MIINDKANKQDIPENSAENRLTTQEATETRQLLLHAARLISPFAHQDSLWRTLYHRATEHQRTHDAHAMPLLTLALDTVCTFTDEIDGEQEMLRAILLSHALRHNLVTLQEIITAEGEDVTKLAMTLAEVETFVESHKMGHQENFRGLLLSMADDIRVIIVMIIRSLVMMRRINLHPDIEWVQEVADEAKVLYSQLAHRLGLYQIKSVLEDLWLKYTDRTTYKEIARHLNETKRSRDAYIQQFISPVKARLEAAGLKFTIKGRTKSIYSIWNKIQNKKVDIDHIYDLFAIRVVIDTSEKREKADCWLGYSVLANMYQPDPTRMRDWLSFPKSNGYESLHITVLGPGDKWVEVQFRSRRMDLVAEKGLAAHWRYKGGKSAGTDRWMNAVRDVLESSAEAPLDAMKQIKPDSSSREVYVFTPKGDLLRLPAGSTLLDFAFAIHTGVGCRCTGGNVNGRYEKISYRLCNGDTIKVLTSATQMPKYDWLTIVNTSKARNKIRQSLDESRHIKAALGKEMFDRRLRNRKLEIDDADFSRFILKQGYKHSTDFFADVADEKIDVRKIIDLLRNVTEEQQSTKPQQTTVDDFVLQRNDDTFTETEPLVIGHQQIKGLCYKFAKCCSPTPGDDVFGFISSDGAVKIHRTDCTNAFNIRTRYPYRIIGVRWASEQGNTCTATLRVVGRDDIGIMTNITSIIDREEGVELYNVQVSSNDGLFCGFLGLKGVDRQTMIRLSRKLQGVKGVKNADLL